jgi:hypothetical protein
VVDQDKTPNSPKEHKQDGASNPRRSSPYAAAANQLLARGYCAIPALPGTKMPGDYVRVGSRYTWRKMGQWTKRFIDAPPTPAEVDHWSNPNDNQGVCVVLGRASGDLVAVDIDSTDPALIAAVEAVLPVSPIAKFGKKGKTLFFHAPGFQPVKLRRKDANGQARPVVEFLAEGNQTVLPPSWHPDTGRPYRYLTEQTLENTDIGELPLLPDDAVARVDAVLDSFGLMREATAAPRVPRQPRQPGEDESAFRKMNDLALEHLDAWVPALGLPRCCKKDGGYKAVAYWRDSGLGPMPVEQRKLNLNIRFDGIKDFGPMLGYTAIDLIIAAGVAPDPWQAFNWLAEIFQHVLPDEEAFLAEFEGEVKPAMGSASTASGLNGATPPPGMNGGTPPPPPPPPQAKRLPYFNPWSGFAAPPFPVETLPDNLRQYAETNAEFIGCDVSALAMGALGVFSGALDHRIRLKLKRQDKYYVHPNLWIALIGNVSAKKSPALERVIAVLNKEERKRKSEYKRQLAQHLANEGKKSDAPPSPARLLLADTTIEGAGKVLEYSPGGALLYRDELAGFIESIDRYSKGGDRPFWLQAYNGGGHTVDRGSQPDRDIENLSVSILGGIQTEKFAELGKALTSDGFLQRFTPVMMADATFGEDDSDLYSEQDYERLMDSALLVPAETTLYMTDDAIEIFTDLRQRLFGLTQVTEGVAKGFNGYIGKLDGLAGRLALLLHLAADPKNRAKEQVSLATIESVEKIVLKFIIPHAAIFYRMIGGASGQDPITQLGSWMLTCGKDRYVLSDFGSNVRGLRGKPANEVQKVISIFEAGGWLAPNKNWPLTTEWNLDPGVRPYFAARAEKEKKDKELLREIMDDSFNDRRNERIEEQRQKAEARRAAGPRYSNRSRDAYDPPF